MFEKETTNLFSVDIENHDSMIRSIKCHLMIKVKGYRDVLSENYICFKRKSQYI